MLFCFHKYKFISLCYKYERDYSDYTIQVYRVLKCQKCGKIKLKNILTYKTILMEETEVIINMLKRHKILDYIELVNKELNDG